MKEVTRFSVIDSLMDGKMTNGNDVRSAEIAGNKLQERVNRRHLY